MQYVTSMAVTSPLARMTNRLESLRALSLVVSLALIAALAEAQRRGATHRTATLAHALGVATSVVDEHLQTLARAGFTAPTQDGKWVLSWSPDSATLHDLYVALGLPLAGTWLARPLAPWQMQVAPAMERIVTAEAAAMRVTLASLLAETRPPTPRPIRAVAERGRAE